MTALACLATHVSQVKWISLSESRARSGKSDAALQSKPQQLLLSQQLNYLLTPKHPRWPRKYPATLYRPPPPPWPTIRAPLSKGRLCLNFTTVQAITCSSDLCSGVRLPFTYTGFKYPQVCLTLYFNPLFIYDMKLSYWASQSRAKAFFYQPLLILLCKIISRLRLVQG